jgi:peroxiredoxin
MILGIVVAAGAALALALTPLNEAAPTFTLESGEGKKVSLEDFKGKWVVLEWWNNGCPIVKRHYGAGTMQKQQAELKDKGVVWLSIVSSAPGTQGYVTVENASSVMKSNKGVPHAVLLDPTGDVGKKYDAKTTPHMFLISPKGEILYNGAIDSNRSGRQAPNEVENYLGRAFEEASAGKEVTTKKTQPYGCNVKYGK